MPQRAPRLSAPSHGPTIGQLLAGAPALYVVAAVPQPSVPVISVTLRDILAGAAVRTAGPPPPDRPVGPQGPEPPPADGGHVAGAKPGLIPAPPRGNLRIGPLTFHTYGLLMGAGVGVAYLMMRRGLGAKSAAAAKLPGLLLPAFVAALIGARLYHVASEWDRYRDHPVDMFKIWQGGLGIFGALAAGASVGGILARRAGLPVAPLLDAAVPGILVAQAIGRLGNYANQELYGRPTDLPWGLQVDRDRRPAEYPDRQSFHPTFLYEALWNLGAAGALMALKGKFPNRAPGTIFALYLAAYGAGRFWIEGLRAEPAKEYGPLRQNQWVSLAMVAGGIAGAVLLNRGRGLH